MYAAGFARSPSAPGTFVLLVRARLLSTWNVARQALVSHPALSVGLTLLGIGLFVGIYQAFGLFLGLVHTPDMRDELVYDLFYFLFLFLLAGAVPFVASTLLHSMDYTLLSAAPIRPRAVIAAKLLDATVTNSLQFAIIGLPAIFACGAAVALPPSGWAATLVVVLLFVLLPALLTALMLLMALGLVGMRRVRNAITTVNAVMATVVCMTIVVQASHLQVHRSMTAALGSIPNEGSSLAHESPSAVFAAILLALARGDTHRAVLGLALAGLVIAGLFALCVALGERLISAATLAEEGEGETPACIGGDSAGGSRAGLLKAFSAPVAALILKDLRYVVRDSVLLSQLGMPIILFFVPFVLAIQDSVRALATPTELYPFAAGMTGVIIFMQTSILSLSSVGLESRSFWLVLASPNGARRLLMAKFAMSTLVSASVGVVLTLLSAFVFRASSMAALAQCVLVLLVCAALCGLGVGISAALPRFVYENPAHRVSAWALVLGFVATSGYLLVSAVVLAGAYLLATQLAEHAAVVYAAGIGLFVLLTAAAAIVPLAIGIRRIDTYQWEH